MNGCYLKKQSQFQNGQNDVKSIITMVYGDFDGPGRRKNKPNSKPISFSPQHCCGVEKQVEKTKPILWKGKSNKAKGKMRVNPGVFPIYS